MKKLSKFLAVFAALCTVLSMSAFAGFKPADAVSETQAPQEITADEQLDVPAEGESAEGESADGESAEGESAEGESADGESAGGESDDSVMAMNAGASSGDVIYSISEDGLVFNEEAEGFAAEGGEITDTYADSLILGISEFTTTGFEVTGGEYTISNTSIIKDVTGEVDENAAGGVCARVTGGILTLANCDFINAGKGGRNGNYTVECNDEGVLVVINSSIVQTGLTGDPEGYTAAIADPPSNAALGISGYARANMSLGRTQTYYYGSYVETEGWAAMSTDSAKKGFAFFSYDSVGSALYGGYGTYADTSCVDWFYATVLNSAEIGAIISNNGEIHMANGADASEEALAYLPEDYKVTDLYEELGGRSAVAAGRNDFQIHSPDMMGSGAGTDYHGVLDLKDTDIETSIDLDEQAILVDWYKDYGPAMGEYIDFVKGANILVKSTGAYITLDNVTTDSYTNVLLLTALNSDGMSRYAKASDDMTGKGTEMTVKNSVVEGDVLNFDYQRNCSVTLENAVWTGAYLTIDKEEWDSIWSDECKADESCVWILDPEVYFDGEGTTAAMVLGENSVWNPVGVSNINFLSAAQGSVINGTVTVDGEAVDVSEGGIWEGDIIVTAE